MTPARRLVPSILVLGVVGAACSSGSGRAPATGTAVTPRSLAAATAAAGPSRMRGTVGGGGASGPVSGTFSAGANRAELRFSVAVGNGTVRPTIRHIEGTVYIHRAIRSKTAAGAGALVTYAGTGPAWIAVPPMGAVELLGPIDPVAAMRLLDKVTLIRVGSAEINGKATTRYRMRPAKGTKTFEVRGVSPFAVPAGGQLELSVDAELRLRRWKLASPGKKVQIDFEYGAGPNIAPPPERDTVGRSKETLPAPSGDWVPFAAGTANGISWDIERGPGTRATTCLRLTTAPAVAAANPVVDGAVCGDPPAADEDTPEYYFDLIFTSAAGDVEAVAALIPKGSADSAEVVFAGGGTAPAAIDPTGAVVYVGPRDKTVALISLRKGPDTYDCGPGSIIEVPDAIRAPVASIHKFRAATAWACTPRYEE